MRQAKNSGRGLWVQITSKAAFRQLLDFRGMTIREVAEKSGCSTATIGYLHNPRDTRCNVSPALAKRIAKTLDFPVEAMFTLKSQPSQATDRIA